MVNPIIHMCCTITHIVLASSPSSRGEGPGTHCMRMRHHSAEYGESNYVWILSVYLYCNISRILTRNVRATLIDTTIACQTSLSTMLATDNRPISTKEGHR